MWLCPINTSMAMSNHDKNIDCEIRTAAEGEFIRIDAVLRTRRAASGSYQFNVQKQSASGTSQNAQSGTFDVQGPAHSVLTSIVIDRPPLGQYRADLNIESDQGSASCVSP
jgi:hypothetical protein